MYNISVKLFCPTEGSTPKMQKKKKITERADRNRKIVAAIAIVFFIAVIGIITAFAAQKIESISSDPEFFRNWISSFGFFGKFIFIGLAAIQVILAVIPGGPVQIAAGYAFGIVEGSILCTIGIQLGSAIAFLLARYLGTKVIYLFFPKEKIESIKFLQSSKRLDLIVFVCFLIPGAPKDLLTYFCGITHISFTRFILLTSLARIPSIVFSVLSGNALVERNYITAIIIISVLVVLSGIGVLVYRNMMNNEAARQKSSDKHGEKDKQ